MDSKKEGASSVRSSKRIWKILPKILLGVVIFILIAYLGLSAYVASALTKPARNFDPAKYNPSQYGLAYEEFTFPSRIDGLEIAGWYIPSEDNQRAIILVHGYNNSRTNGFVDEFVSFAGKLHQAGFSVLLIDLRGHGESADARFTFGTKERNDILGAVDWLETRGFQAGKIGLLGYSLGAGSIVGAASEETDIGAIWVDSLFTDIKSVLDHSWTSFTGLPKVFMYSTVLMVRVFYGYNILASRPIDEISKIAPRPIFMTHCEKDNLIPISHMEKLLTVVQPAGTWVIPSCDIHTLSNVPADFREVFNNHAIGYPVNQEEYSQKVIVFFDKNL